MKHERFNQPNYHEFHHRGSRKNHIDPIAGDWVLTAAVLGEAVIYAGIAVGEITGLIARKRESSTPELQQKSNEAPPPPKN